MAGFRNQLTDIAEVRINGVRLQVLHKVTLYRSKGNKDPVILTYVEETLRRSQARFLNRTTLTPQIDLNAYRCTAVVDWIDVEFELMRQTQYWKLNERIAKLTGRKEFPEALDLGPGRTVTLYKLRVQEPDLKSLRKVLMNLDAEYGFAASPRIAGIEFSVDFYPKSPSEEARARIHGVLIRHLFPTTKVLRSNRTWPRFTPGSIKSTDYIISRNESDDSLDIGDRMSPGLDRIVPYGSTYYVGERDDPRAFWRVQNKVLDKQNKVAGTKDELPEDKKRVRIEVTLGSEGCREIGLHNSAIWRH